jgi:hypothetical protein
MKKFHVGDVLSITTGKLLSLQGMAGIYEILDYMTDKEHYTHELPNAGNICKPVLLKQFPQLKEETGEGVNSNNWKDYLKRMEEKYGEFLEVKKLTI